MQISSTWDVPRHCYCHPVSICIDGGMGLDNDTITATLGNRIFLAEENLGDLWIRPRMFLLAGRRVLVFLPLRLPPFVPS